MTSSGKCVNELNECWDLVFSRLHLRREGPEGVDVENMTWMDGVVRVAIFLQKEALCCLSEHLTPFGGNSWHVIYIRRVREARPSLGSLSLATRNHMTPVK
jgi:hypothetical protein